MVFVMLPVLFTVFTSLYGRFQQHYHTCKTSIEQERAQSCRTNNAFANTSMDITMTAQSFLGIIEMDYLKAGESDGLIHLPEHLLGRLGCRNIVPGSPEMGSIKANAQTISILG